MRRKVVFTPDIGTTNPQIRCKPRRNVALGDNARRCMVCTSLVAAPPRCVESLARTFFTTEGTEDTAKKSAPQGVYGSLSARRLRGEVARGPNRRTASGAG